VNRTVTLLRYAKVADIGWRRGAAVIGSLRNNQVLVSIFDHSSSFLIFCRVVDSTKGIVPHGGSEELAVSTDPALSLL